MAPTESTKHRDVTELTLAQTLHPLPMVLSVSVEADRPRCLTELAQLAEATELTVAHTLHPLPLMVSVSVEADRRR